MSENHTTETKSVRELAREYVEAHEAFINAYRANSAAGLSLEERIDRQLACDAALKTSVDARVALDAAQAVAA